MTGRDTAPAPSTPAPSTPAPSGSSSRESSTTDYKFRIPYWIRQNPRLLAEWEYGIIEYGYEGAEDYVRSTKLYEKTFPGIKRDDGSYRMEEGEYLSTIDSYKTSLKAVGVNPKLFRGKFIALIEGDVSGDEFWQERVAPIYDQVIDRGRGLIERYAADWGLEMTRASLIASLLDPDDLGSKILQRQIGISEIRYESDVALGQNETNRWAPLTEDLYEFGVSKEQARNLFQQAETVIPLISVLAQRNADPDDEFNLDDFTAASIYNDPEQARRMRRLIAQEQASFVGGQTLDYAASRKTGGIIGLDVV